jgi:DNA excision repair protein ERCC-5
MAGITDGTITEDSDVWLFGGRVAYRNVFATARHMEVHRVRDIAREVLGVETEGNWPILSVK